MLIIVEGPDGSGKTTLVDNLATDLIKVVVDDDGKPIKGEYQYTAMQVMHSGPLRVNPLVEYEERLRNYDPFEDVIACDRWHVGELIYGPLLRGSSQLTPAMKKHVDLLLLKLGAVKVFMDTDFETTVTRAYGRGEDLIPEQHARLVWDAYQEICTLKDNWLPVSKYKPEVIMDTARVLRLKAQALHRFKSYVGPKNPGTLIVGDKPDPHQNGRTLSPLSFMPWTGSSGEYLLTTLEAGGCRGYGLADARRDNISDLWETLGKPRVVILGEDAKQAMRIWPDVKDSVVATLEHPRYVSGFKMGALHKYAEFLKEAVNG